MCKLPLMVSNMNLFVDAECSLSFDANPVCVLLSVSAQQFVTRTIVWPAPIRSSTATWLICKHTIVHIISIAYYVCSISAICVRTEKMTFKCSEHSLLSKTLSKRGQLMIWFSVPSTVATRNRSWLLQFQVHHGRFRMESDKPGGSALDVGAIVALGVVASENCLLVNM